MRLSAFVAMPLLLASLVGCEPPLPVPPRSGVQPTANPGGLTLLYRAPQAGSFRYSRPVTDGERVFADGNGQRLVALDRATGAELWATEPPADEWFGSPILHQGVILVAGHRARAYAPATGTALWTGPPGTGAFGHTPAAGGGRFYIGTDSSVFALDAATGALVWRTGLGAGWSYPGRTRGVAADGEMVVACAQEPLEWNGWRSAGHVVAFDAATGAIRWRYRMSFETEFNFCFSEPLITATHVIVPDAGGNNIVGLDRASGEFQWRYRGEPGWVGPYEPPSALGDTLFVASNDESVTALSMTTGAQIWRTKMDGSTRAVAACGRVLLATNMSLNVLDRRTGAVLAKDAEGRWQEGGDLLSTRFLVVGDTAFILGNRVMLAMRCPS